MSEVINLVTEPPRVEGQADFLTFVAPFASSWPTVEEARVGYLWALGQLVPKDGSPARVLHCYERERRERRLDEKFDRAGEHGRERYAVHRWLCEQLTHDPTRQPPGEFAALAAHYAGFAGTAPWISRNDVACFDSALEVVEKGLDRFAEAALLEAAVEPKPSVVVDQLNLFCLRLFFSGRQLLQRLGLPESPDADSFVAIVELRFEHEFHKFWTIATLSLWTQRPRDPHHAPSPDEEELALGRKAVPPDWRSWGSADAAGTTHEVFTNVALGFERLLFHDYSEPLAELTPDRKWPKPRLKVDDSSTYETPHFWFAGPKELPDDVAQHLDSPGLRDADTTPLARAVLGVREPRSSGVAGGILLRNFLTLRRFRPGAGHVRTRNRPTYLLMVGQGPRLEEDGHEIVRTMSNFELQVATALFDFDSDFENFRSNLDTYAYVAGEASVLLDALALHLPLAQRRDRNCLYGSIELVHQTLLQGVADLGQVSVEMQRTHDNLIRKIDRLVESFDDQLEERTVSSGQSIRASLTETGYVERAKKSAFEGLRQATLVRESYDNLLKEMTLAFDERRARETEVLAQRTESLSAMFGLLGLVTVIDFLVEASLNKPSWLLTLGRAAVVAIALGVIGFLGWRYRTGREVGKLGDRSFRARYASVERFLADSSTDSLRRKEKALEDSTGDDAGAFGVEWDKFDARLSSSLAACWDASRQRPEHHKDPTSLFALESRVGMFTCRSLLLSERTRRFWELSLVQVACLYRLLKIDIRPPTFPAVDDWRVVSDFDVGQALMRIGFPFSAHDKFFEWEQTLQSYAEYRKKVSGKEPEAHWLLEKLRRLGIRNDVNPRELMTKLQQDIDRWRGRMRTGTSI